MSHSVLIADDNLVIRQGLCELFESEPDFVVCGDAENGKEAVEKAQDLHPDLIVLDLSMPVMNGLDAARVLTDLLPEVPVIMFSAFSEPFTERAARSAGAKTLVSKSEHISILLAKARSLMPESLVNERSTDFTSR
ncbi:MAG TPA: response regulator transcription factor [Terriglobales bacterium]|nr:response regulator transcription factor [Terriglobales bacterium]